MELPKDLKVVEPVAVAGAIPYGVVVVTQTDQKRHTLTVWAHTADEAEEKAQEPFDGEIDVQYVRDIPKETRDTPHLLADTLLKQQLWDFKVGDKVFWDCPDDILRYVGTVIDAQGSSAMVEFPRGTLIAEQGDLFLVDPTD